MRSLRLTLSPSALSPPRSCCPHCWPATSRRAAPRESTPLSLCGTTKSWLFESCGRHLPRGNFVLEGVRVEAVEPTVGSFCLRIHEKCDRLATRSRQRDVVPKVVL